jgi:hypothetical protein
MRPSQEISRASFELKSKVSHKVCTLRHYDLRRLIAREYFGAFIRREIFSSYKILRRL